MCRPTAGSREEEGEMEDVKVREQSREEDGGRNRRRAVMEGMKDREQQRSREA